VRAIPLGPTIAVPPLPAWEIKIIFIVIQNKIETEVIKVY
jgi:hypothetical protein